MKKILFLLLLYDIYSHDTHSVSILSKICRNLTTRILINRYVEINSNIEQNNALQKRKIGRKLIKIKIKRVCIAI